MRKILNQRFKMPTPAYKKQYASSDEVDSYKLGNMHKFYFGSKPIKNSYIRKTDGLPKKENRNRNGCHIYTTNKSTWRHGQNFWIIVILKYLNWTSLNLQMKIQRQTAELRRDKNICYNYFYGCESQLYVFLLLKRRLTTKTKSN